MKYEIYRSKITELETLKGKILLVNEKPVVIRDWKTVEETVPVKRFGIRTGKTRTHTYVTEMTVEGWNAKGKFKGTHGDEFCEMLLACYRDLFHYRNLWNDVCDALKAYGLEVKRIEETTPVTPETENK